MEKCHTGASGEEKKFCFSKRKKINQLSANIVTDAAVEMEFYGHLTYA